MSSLKKFAFVAPLILLSACKISWTGQGRGAGQTAQTDPTSVASLQSQYDTQKYFQDLRRRRDGLENSFGRDLASITSTFDRHLFNYSKDDPYVNHPSSASAFNHMMRFTVDTTYPLTSYVTTGNVTNK